MNLEDYVTTYKDKVTAENAEQAIVDFDNNWQNQQLDNWKDEYEFALVCLSTAYSEIPSITEKNVKDLISHIQWYEQNDCTKYKATVKYCLYGYLGVCWYKLGTRYHDDAVSAFKRSLYYLLGVINNHSFAGLTAYAFRRCNEFLYKSIVNQQLNISSPSEFNDPFDCPIMVLLNKFGDEINQLILRAYNDCLKIACFSKNQRLLPEIIEDKYVMDEEGHFVYKNKIDNSKAEFLNELMWAHYADFHKGICIKYHFNSRMTNMIEDNENKIISYFRDVKYSDDDMSKYSNLNTISSDDSFFLKGKSWEYENELRYLYFDIEGKGKHKQIDIPNCIEAVYFGVKCSQSDKDSLRKLLGNEKLITYDLEGNKSEKSIEFYQMEMDMSHFGQLKAVKL